MRTEARERATDRIVELSQRGLDLETFWRGCGEVLATAVPHHLAPCWYTLDPSSLLITSHFDPVITEIDAEMLVHEYYADDVMKLADVARSDSGVASLYDQTGGDPSRSEAWCKFVQPYGGDQQIAVALRTKPAEAWGVLALYRNPDQATFSADEIGFLADIAPPLTAGARRGLLFGEAAAPDLPLGPSLIVLDEDWNLLSLTPGSEDTLESLPGGDSWRVRGALPPSVLAVAGRSLRSYETADTSGEVAVARVRDRHGRWLTLHGAPMLREDNRRVAVIIERSDPNRIAPLLMEAYGFTEREKEVTMLVLQGESNNAIAASLVVSPHTVQQHMKNVFAKTGVHSRRELVGQVFFTHYEPRVRDNERRVAGGQPIIGTPTPGRGDR